LGLGLDSGLVRCGHSVRVRVRVRVRVSSGLVRCRHVA